MNEARESCLITGAAGDIGQELVKRFADAGYDVIALDVVPGPVDLACKHYLQADLSLVVNDEMYAHELVHDVRRLSSESAFKAIVNNAAVQILGATDDLTRTDWRTSLDVNLLAPFFLAQALLPDLEANDGSIVNISSIHAGLTKPEFVAYATSKAALSGLTRAMAVDLGSRVRVNAIEPAAIDTKMLRAGFDKSVDKLNSLSNCHPVGRLGSPHEVAAMALWLVSNEASFVSGLQIPLDGAISARLHDPD